MSATIRGDRRQTWRAALAAQSSLLLTCLLISGSGCFQESKPAADGELAALLRQIQRAQTDTNFQGLRRRVQRDRDDAQRSSRFVERVFHVRADSDGTPERHLVQLERVEDEGSTPRVWDEERFEQLNLSLRLRSNFIERYREVRIADVDLLLENYNVSKSDGGTVLNRPCLLIELAPRHGSHELGLGLGRYQLWVDARTHLPLRTREFAVEDGAGTLVGESEFLSVEELSHPEDVAWPSLEIERVALAEGALPEFFAGRSVGFPPPVEGFRTLRREALRAPGVGSLVLHLASDGLEPVLVLQVLPEVPARLEVKGTEEARDLLELEILKVEFGRTTALATTYDGVTTYLIAKATQTELRPLFEELFRF